jgi:hypothetical protein
MRRLVVLFPAGTFPELVDAPGKSDGVRIVFVAEPR